MVIHKCGIDDCKYETKYATTLKRHKAAVHDIDVTWFHCDIDDCKYKGKQNHDLKQHKANAHDIDVTWFTCDIGDCQYKGKHKGDLKQHKANAHDIDVTWFMCDISDCKYKGKRNDHLKQHKANVHDIDVLWFHCGIGDCKYKCKHNHDLKKHLTGVHDIGTHQCDYCVKNTYSTNKYICPKSLIESSICRECYRKVTGYTSRIEKEISEYLDKVPKLYPYLIGSDRAFKSIGGCSLYRPDKLYIGVDLNIIFECDEHQHSGSNYKCDERRLSEMFDEFETKKLVVIRWNPDTYKVPKDTKRASKKQRFERAKEVLLDTLRNPPPEPVSVVYMYYDEDNDNLVQNLPKTFIR